MAGPFARIPFSRGRSVVLWQEDALAALPVRVPRADVVVTSPPYNRGVPYASYGDARPRAEYLAWIARLGRTVADRLAPNGSFFLNVGAAPKDPWIAWDVAREVGRSLVLQNTIHWVKSIAIDREAAGRSAGLGRDLALGHYKPLVSDRFVHGAHEYVFHFTRTGRVPIDRLAIGVPYQDKSNVGRWRRAAGDRRCRGNTWFLPYATIRRRATDRPHPAPFPTELPEWCVRLHGVGRTRLVVDPFVGIGASALAAVRLGVGFVGFDVDAGYLATAAERVRAELARPKGGRVRPTGRPRATTRRSRPRPTGPTTRASASA
ncbi:MAG TPA: site-specific DNA-methyltransferase [Thermoplasmata archaeon]|nr:site-specific DNA-methyltransferase [Thermoplasmata archaeon]